MDFFEHQDRARRNTGKLLAMFLIAVVLIALAVNLVVVGIFHTWNVFQAHEDLHFVTTAYPEAPEPRPVQAPWIVYVYVTGITLLVITGGSLYKMAALSAGGVAVAQMLGGRMISPDPEDPDELKLRNVVEEMSIASGAPVPQIYVMDNERGINAFAAGLGTSDAVIGVTRGCIEQLTRDELQGVVAHEFSHILHGDMRLNVRLIGILHGIFVIGLIGYVLLRGAVRSGGGRDSAAAVAALSVLGAALLVIGYTGVFFGRLIQAAVSRQREYLADAAAVQFTRNPGGLAGALKKIGGYSFGSRVQKPQALEASHLFFGNAIASNFSRLLSTHPPLVKRIRAIDPTFDGRFPFIRAEAPTAPPPIMQPPPLPQVAHAHAGAAVAATPREVISTIGEPQAQHVLFAAHLLNSVPSELSRAVHDPFGARAVVFCLLIDSRPMIRRRQLDHLRSLKDSAVVPEVERLLSAVEAMGPGARLPLLDLAIPALRRMSQQQAEQFMRVLRSLIDADAQVSIFEYSLFKIVRQHLEQEGQKKQPVARYHALRPLLSETATLLFAVARAGQDADSAAAAFAAGVEQLEQPELKMIPPDLSSLDQAVDRLALASPGVKRRVMQALAFTAAHDGTIHVEEAELLRAIGTTLQVPIPPLAADTAPAGVQKSDSLSAASAGGR